MSARPPPGPARAGVAPPPQSFTLLAVPPRRGWAWVRQGLAAFGRKPLPYSSLLAAFLFASMLVLSLPYVGAVLLLMALPLLTLGYMIATRSGEAGGPVHPGHLIEPLRAGDRARRNRLLWLCAAYAVSTLAVIALAGAIDGGRFERLQVLLASADTDQATRDEIDTLLADDALLNGMLMRFGLLGLLSVPFWHAPALVWWGGQGVAQSLFSSTLAVWRNKGAFALYGAGWVGLVAGFGVIAGGVLSLLGARAFIGVVALPAGLMASTAFYVSLYFTFADSFGTAAPTARAADPGDDPPDDPRDDDRALRARTTTDDAAPDSPRQEPPP